MAGVMEIVTGLNENGSWFKREEWCLEERRLVVVRVECEVPAEGQRWAVSLPGM